jgi:hydrogenase nickel incorporation protein HypA/HybF
MHELAIGRAVLRTALDHADGRRVRRIAVSVGALRQVAPASLAFYLEVLARGTACEGAELELRSLPPRMRCGCGQEWEPQEPSFRCPVCASPEAAILTGEELAVEEIEVEEVERCTGRR